MTKSHSSHNEQAARILVVDDHASARQSVVDVLRHGGRTAESCSSGAEALQKLSARSFELVITDLQMPGMSGLDLIREIERRRWPIQVLMVTAHASIGVAVEAMRHGAFDFLEKPYDIDQIEQSVARALERGRLQSQTTSSGMATDGPTMIGTSLAMTRLREQIGRVAATDETVLICGESGVGKELVAQTLHTASRRSASPLVSLNCPVLSEQLTESELFGHCRGAFTGADADRIGRFELAEGGSLLLDEITEINLGLQAKLLRVLQERTFERVGSSETRKIDVRVLATTNRDLSEEIAAGRFREDLYYRLAVVPLRVPPLREREGDVLLLANHFLNEAAGRLDREPLVLDAAASELLDSHHWPGNVRELHNVITRACVLSDTPSISPELIRPWLRQDSASSPAALTTTAEEHPATLPLGLSLAEIEKQMILGTLEQHGGHRAKTAEALGIGVRTLSGKLRSYGVAPRENQVTRAA